MAVASDGAILLSFCDFFHTTKAMSPSSTSSMNTSITMPATAPPPMLSSSPELASGAVGAGAGPRDGARVGGTWQPKHVYMHCLVIAAS